MEQRDFTRAVPLLEQTLALSRDVGYKVGVAWTLQNLSWVALWQGDYARGTALNEESLTVFRELEEPPGADGTACCLMARGVLELGHGALAEARVALADSLGRFAAYHDQRNIARCLEGFAALAAAHARQCPEDTEHARRAARLWGAAEALRSASGFRQPPADRVHDEPYLAAARTQLDDATWAVAWAEGRAMTTEQAVAYALEGAPDV
jgi:hypothetical protein